jgi:S1-C subfamily serine protease
MGDDGRAPAVVVAKQSPPFIPAGDISLPTVIQQAQRSVVALDVTSRTWDASRQLPVRTESFGSGFVLTADGFIATAAHVVKDAVIIAVTLPDGGITTGTVVGRNEEVDLAVIRVARTDLHPVELGSSALLQTGDMVVVIGNAMGLRGSPSATLGIVSALGRDVSTDAGTPYTHMIQVDAHVNAGNSGGPMINASGQVVGVASANVKANAGTGIGFATPMDIAAPVLFGIIGAGH